MRHAFEKAGVETAGNQLYVAAVEALKRANKNPALAIEGFLEQLMKDARPLMALMGIAEKDVRHRAFAYLRERADDMARKARTNGGASQRGRDSHSLADRPATWTPADIQPAASDAGASHAPVERQTATDRPGKQKPARSKINPGAFQRAIDDGPFGHPVGTGKRPLGQITWREVHHLGQRRAKDAFEAAEDVVLMNALVRFVPDDPKKLDMQIGSDPRVEEMRPALENALVYWQSVKQYIGKQPLGDLEKLLVTAGGEHART